MTILIYAKKIFWQNSNPFMIITLQRVGKEGTYLNIIKSIYDRLTTDIIFNGEKLENISFKIRNKSRISTLTTYFNTVLEILAIVIWEQKEIKGIQIGKEVKLSLFADDIILYVENPEDATRKLLELTNEFDNVAR